MSKSRRTGFSLRAKLLLLSIAVLAIPYAGLSYLREFERYLRDSLETGLMDAARAVAGPLHDRQDLFPEDPEPPERTLYVHPLDHPVQLDGYTDDWSAYISWSTTYGAPPGPTFRFIVSRHDPYYYGLLQVRDDSLVLQRGDSPDAVDNDHVVLVITDPDGGLERYFFSPGAPGRIRPFRFERERDDYGFETQVARYAANIIGEFQPVEGGYNLEIAVPTHLVGDRMGLAVVDVDDPVSRIPVATVGTAGADTLQIPGRILEPSARIVRMARRFADTPGRRIWVLDRAGRVLASVGDLEAPRSEKPAGLLYRLILPPAQDRFVDDLVGVSRLQGEEVQSALAGITESRWRSSPDGGAIIVSAAAPVFLGEDVQGAVVVEETTGGIQVLQREAMTDLFNKTFLVFLVLTAAVLLFATWLSARLRRLSREADAAIDEHGRVVEGFRPSQAGDEIGELSRTYAGLLSRLQDYHSYLEKLAGRLSHELRTPITVVRSSLEQLRSEAPAGDVYLERARDGVERLDLIVTRLSEAARLEEALAVAEPEDTDVPQLLRGCVQGYELAYPDLSFELNLPGDPLRHRLAPELLVQMLDKLVANAADFHADGTPVRIDLLSANNNWILRVSNKGPLLDVNATDKLFHSMFSGRSRSNGRVPHLGLGLYLVRLIAEYHGASVRAFNLPDQSGVAFEVAFYGSS